MTREQMWYAPSAEDWAKPVLIQWQRSWEDAAAVSAQIGRPILVCVNMDGEIASEHYAGVRYRMPEIAELYEPYVCVIASVYRHTPRDYDAEGRRIPCPRFGGVTCGEHIRIEPIVFEKFLDGARVSPRHIMVELDGSEVYDVYYAWDTQSVFDTIEAGMAERADTPPPVVRGDRPITERVGSRDARDRAAVEKAWQEGDARLRSALLAAAEENPDADPVDLLRLAVFDLDAGNDAAARAALARTDSEGAVELIAEVLRVPLEQQERDTLVAALERIGADSRRARRLATVHRGLDAAPGVIDVEGWSDALAGATYAPPDPKELDAALDAGDVASREDPADAEARLALAEAALAFAADPENTARLAADPGTAGKFWRAQWTDALLAAQEAEELGASGWRVDTVIGVASFYLGDTETAVARADRAVPALPPGDTSWSSMAILDIYADAKRRAISTAALAKEEWPAEWLAELHAAYSVLSRHPLGSEPQAVMHYDFLKWLDARGEADAVLQDALRRFPESWQLHARLRDHALAERGVEGLEAVYTNWLQRADAPARLEWYAGYAALVAAEYQRRGGDGSAAHAAYERCIARFEDCIAKYPETQANSDVYVALALAGQARVALEAGELPRALELLLASFEREPGSAGTQDGLWLSGVATARTLRARFAEAGDEEAVARVDAALAALPPEELQRPEWDREVPGGARGREGLRRGGRRPR
jgi:hypothetical protein